MPDLHDQILAPQRLSFVHLPRDIGGLCDTHRQYIEYKMNHTFFQHIFQPNQDFDIVDKCPRILRTPIASHSRRVIWLPRTKAHILPGLIPRVVPKPLLPTSSKGIPRRADKTWQVVFSTSNVQQASLLPILFSIVFYHSFCYPIPIVFSWIRAYQPFAFLYYVASDLRQVVLDCLNF